MNSVNCLLLNFSFFISLSLFMHSYILGYGAHFFSDSKK